MKGHICWRSSRCFSRAAAHCYLKNQSTHTCACVCIGCVPSTGVCMSACMKPPSATHLRASDSTLRHQKMRTGVRAPIVGWSGFFACFFWEMAQLKFLKLPLGKKYKGSRKEASPDRSGHSCIFLAIILNSRNI